MMEAHSHMKLDRTGASTELIDQWISTFAERDVQPLHNFGSFVTTQIDQEAKDLLLATYGKNAACRHEYPSVPEIEGRCISILADLWTLPKAATPIGAATSGSSEAIFLSIWAFKLRWQINKTRGVPNGERSEAIPNLVVGSHVHVSITKGATACGVVTRTVPVVPELGYTVDGNVLEQVIDENTIGVIAIMGNTYTGNFDSIHQISQHLAAHERKTRIRVPMHVDAASGGFFAPFTKVAERDWDFSNPFVDSINASGHKFGLTPPAIGWVLWRNEECRARGMLSSSSYLSGDSESVKLSFSQPSSGVLLQYFNFLRLGIEGFKDAAKSAMLRAARFRNLLKTTGLFDDLQDVVLEPGKKPAEEASGIKRLPVIAFKFKNQVKHSRPAMNEEKLSEELRRTGYSLPFCYLETIQGRIPILRAVARPELTDKLFRQLFDEIMSILSK